MLVLRTLLVLTLLVGGSVAAWRLARSNAPALASERTQAAGTTIAARFEPPRGFRRPDLPPGSFGAYLRSLPLKPDGAQVRLHDGRPKKRQDVHAAVLALDLGPRDLQQCADSILRLRAEHLYGAGRMDEIAFHFTSGFLCTFARWRLGERPHVRGNAVTWGSGGTPDASPGSLRRYLDVVYTYAGTRSLPRDLVRVAEPARVQVGDVYLKPGSPGHAMLVVDLALDAQGRRAVLLVQGYMPAQEIHVVRNHVQPALSPWFVVGDDSGLRTPEWSCGWGDLWRFPPAP